MSRKSVRTDMLFSRERRVPQETTYAMKWIGKASASRVETTAQSSSFLG